MPSATLRWSRYGAAIEPEPAPDVQGAMCGVAETLLRAKHYVRAKHSLGPNTTLGVDLLLSEHALLLSMLDHQLFIDALDACVLTRV